MRAAESENPGVSRRTSPRRQKDTVESLLAHNTGLRNRLEKQQELIEPILSALSHDKKYSRLSDYDEFHNHHSNSYNRFTTHLAHMPAWYVDNEFINGGYRRITNSYRGCFSSLLYLHNETGNVYTHLIGSIIFCIMFPLALFWVMDFSTTNIFDHLVVTSFFFGAVACLAASTTFHLCCCHSREASSIWNKCDYVLHSY